MTKTEFHATLDDILEVPIGTIQGNEVLKNLSTWDSLAVVNYIATCNGLFGVFLEGSAVKACLSVEDLISLVKAHITD